MITDASLRQLAEKATPGPWGLQGANADFEIIAVRGRENGWATGVRVLSIDARDKDHVTHEDAEFMAAAGPDVVLSLLDRVEAKRYTAKETAMAWLSELGADLLSQDNCSTAFPIFTVQQRRRIYGFDTNYSDEFVWISADESIEADAVEAATLEYEYDETGEERENWTRTAYVDQWEFVTASLTRKAAEDYITSQRHNLTDPRVYVERGYRNIEWIALRSALKTLAENGGT